MVPDIFPAENSAKRECEPKSVIRLPGLLSDAHACSTQDVGLWSPPVPAAVSPRPLPAVPAVPAPGEDLSLRSDPAGEAPGAGLRQARKLQ